MEPFVKFSFLLFLFVFGVKAGPIEWQPLPPNGYQCASRCRPDPHFVRFDSGKSYFYRLQTQTLLEGGYGGAPQDPPLLLDALVVVNAHSGCDLSLQLVETRISGVSSDSAHSMQLELEATPLYFGYSDGVITDVCSEANVDSDWSLNVKKAIVSALQMTSPSLQMTSSVVEKDFLGVCQTTYRPMSERFGKHVILKRKSLQNCEDREQWFSGFFPKSYSKSLQKSIPFINGSLECIQSLESDLIFGVTCRETQHVFALRQQMAFNSELNLRFEKQENHLFYGLGRSGSSQVVLRRHENHLKMSFNYNQKELNFDSVLSQLCQRMDERSDEKKSKINEIFNDLIQTIQRSSPEVIERQYESIINGQKCPQNQNRIKDIYLDACAQSATQGGAKVLKNWFQNSNSNRNSIKSQLLFQLLGFSSEPEVKALEPLIDILEHNYDQKHVVYGVTGFIHNVKHVAYDHQLVIRAEERAIEILSRVLKANGNEFQSIVAIKGLENMGLERSATARQLLAKVASESSAEREGARVAAVKALSEYMSVNERTVLMKIFENERNSNELRINCYKALVLSGSLNGRQDLERIRQIIQNNNNQDIRQYVRTHARNLRQTSDPHKKEISKLFNDVIREEPMNQWMGVSNNFETSFMFDALGLGAVLESDVIYEREDTERAIPTSFVFNSSFPLFGRELNLIELEFRQKGFQNVFEYKLKKIFESLEQKNPKIFIENLFQTIYSLKNSIHAQNAFFEVHVKIDGKHVFSVNSHELHSQPIMTSLFDKSFVQILRQMSQYFSDSALALQPVQMRVHLPTSSGFPLIARVNSSIVAHVRPQRDSNHVSFWPSITWRTEAGLQVMARAEPKEVGVALDLESEPVFDSILELTQNSFDFKVLFEKQRINLFKAETELKTGSGSQLWTGSQSDWIRCSQWTKKPFGFEICVQKSSQKFEIFVRKTEQSLNSYVIHASRASDYSYHVLIDSPNSQIERRFEGLFELMTQSENQKRLKMAFNSPFGHKLSLNSELKTEDDNKQLILQVFSDQKPELDLNFQLESIQRGQKRDFRPRVRVTWRRNDVINVGGSVSVSKGRKNQLMINLEGNQKQFLKGSLVREGDRKSNDIRVSSDLSIQLLNGFEIKFSALLDKSQKHVTNDVQIEYRANAHARKETVKTSVKLQSLSQSESVQKLSFFSEISLTQFPSYNSHVSYNLLNKVKEHVENELTVQWGPQLHQKVHVLQVSKHVDGQHVQNTLNLEISPLKVDYELRANGLMTSDENSVDVTGKDRTGRLNGRQDFKANFRYKHVSRAPLHVTLDANLRSNEREFSYSDDLRETRDNEYKGVTSLKWGLNKNQLKSAKMEYNYKKKDENKAIHHEMDYEVTSSDWQPIKHSALLRMSRNDVNIKSKLLIGSELNHNLDTYLTNQGSNRLEWEGLGYQVNAHAHPYQLPQRAGLVLVTPSSVTHRTDLEFIPKTSLKLKSETKDAKNQNIFSLESDISDRNPSKIALITKSLDGRVDYRTGSDEHVATLAVNHMLDDWTHSSSLRSVPSMKSLEFESKTVSKDFKPFYSIQTKFEPKIKKSLISVSLPPKKTSVLFESKGIPFYGTGSQTYSPSVDRKWAKLDVNCGPNFRHSSEYSEPETEVKSFVSKQSDFRSGLPLYSLDYNYGKGIHSLNGEFGNNYLIDGQLKTSYGGGYGDHADINGQYLNWNLKNKKQDFEQTMKIKKIPEKISIESQLRKSGQNLAELSGHLAHNWDSELSIKAPRAQTRAFVAFKPQSDSQYETKVQFKSPRVEHVTNLDYNWPKMKTNFDSKTVFNDNHVTSYQLAGNHDPNRKSFISVKTPLYDVSGHVENTWETPSAKVSIIGPKVSHVSEVSVNRDRKQLRIESRSDRKSSLGSLPAENVYNFEGNYYHLNEEIPSDFAIKTGNQWKINGKTIPFGTGKRFVTIQAEHPLYSHLTDIHVNNENHVTLESKTSDQKSGRNLAKIDSYFTTNPLKDKSRFQLSTPLTDVTIEANPSQRLAKVFYNDNQWNHKSVLNSNLNQYSVDSQTKYKNNPFFGFQTQYSPQKQLKVAINTPNIGHVTHLTRDSDHVIQLDSNTDYLNRNINKIRLNSKEFEFECPKVNARGLWNQNGGQLEYKTKNILDSIDRHVLASVQYINNQIDNQLIGFDIAWDLQQNPNQRLKLNWEARDANARVVHVLTADYAGNEWQLTSDTAKRHVFYGPNTWSLEYWPQYEREVNSMALKVSHVFRDNGKEPEMECRLQYLEGKREKFSTLLNSKIERQTNNELSFVSLLDITSAENKDLNLKVSLRARVQDLKGRNARIMTEIKALRAEKEYAVSWHVARDQTTRDTIKGEGLLETPSLGRKEVNFELNLDQNSIEFNAKSVEKKLLEFLAKIEGNGNDIEKHLTLDLKSNIREIPSISVSGQYLRSKELSFWTDIDGQRKAEMSLIRTGNDLKSGLEWNFRFDSYLWPKFETKTVLKSNSFEKEFEIQSKINSKEVFSANISAKKQTGSGVWTGSARVSQNGAQLAEMALKEVIGPQNLFSYVFSAQNQRRNRFLGEFKAFFSIQKLDKKSTKISVNFCENEEKSKCFFTLIGFWKTRDSQRHVFPVERAEVSLNGNGNEIQLKTSFNEELTGSQSTRSQSLLGVTGSEQRVDQKLRNELSFAINDHKMGFEAIETTRGRVRRDLLLKMEFPNGREAEVKLDSLLDFTSGQMIVKTEVKDIQKQRIVFESEFKSVSNEREINSFIKYKIFGQNRDKKIEFWFEKPSKELKIDFKTKISFDLTEKENNFITIRTEIQRIPETPEARGKTGTGNGFLWNRFSSGTSDSLNNTFLFEIQSKDRKQIDLSLRAHASTKTLGFELTNQNRNGRKQWAHLFVQSEPSTTQSERRFSAIASTNQKRYRVEGAWHQPEQQSGRGYQLSYKLFNERTGEKSDVTLALNGNCLQWDSRSLERPKQTLKYDLCWNSQQKRDKSIDLSLLETSSDGQTNRFSANIEVDTRNERNVKIEVDWSPQWVQKWAQYGWPEVDFRNTYLTEVLNEFLAEVNDKWAEVVVKQSEAIFAPILDEIQDLFQELAKIFGPFERIIEIQRQMSSEFWEYFQQISRFFEYYVSDVWRPLTRNMRKQCNKWEVCYKFVYGLEKYGFDSIIDYFQWNSIRFLKESHRLIVNTSGKAFKALPVPDWLQDYRQSFWQTLQSIIDSNESLKSIYESIDRLLRELTKDFEEINSTELKNALLEFFKTVFDFSAQRVVVWDPNRGRFQLVVKETPLRRGLRSISDQSVKRSMF